MNQNSPSEKHSSHESDRGWPNRLLKNLWKHKFVRDASGLLLLIVFVFLPLTFLTERCDEKKLAKRKEKMQLTTGTIVKRFAPLRSAGRSFEYVYYVGGKRYSHDYSVNLNLYNRFGVFENKRFPVVYEKDNPSNGKMLIFRQDFPQYGIAFPDSLRWAQEMLENSP